MDSLRRHMSKVKIPLSGDKVYREECIYSFDNPESETGLYVCLNTFLGIGREYIDWYSSKTGNCVFLHIHHTKTELPPEVEPEPEKKIARLAIGVEGGFSPDVGKKRYQIHEEFKVVVFPEFAEIAYPNEDLPEIVSQSISAILKNEGALHIAEVEAAALAWDGEIRLVTKHTNTLQQHPTNLKISSSGWKCEICEKTDNLWLNLTDGRIFCGRRQLDGSGGNNHAIDHYQKMKYPLAVKLGTITPDGKADVFSYDENDMVIDSNLVPHLAHFGINVSTMEKTEKTMLELEIDYNQRGWEWSRLTESGTKLDPKYGSGFTGMKNLGNSCYLNSVMQLLMTVPSFADRFYEKRKEIMESCNASQVPQDFNAQMAKLAHGLHSGRYSQPPPEMTEPLEVDSDSLENGISPLMFRTLVGRGHPEFSTKKQQDSMEFLEHVLKLVTRNSMGAQDPGHCFQFEVEDKFVCSASGKVRYVTRNDLCLPLPVPLEAATNKAEVTAYLKRKAESLASGSPTTDDEVHSKIPFSAGLSKLAAPEQIRAFSSAVNEEVPMQKITRLSTFPDYLIIQLVKFGISPNWEPVKHDVSVDMPDELDLSVLKGFGHQPNEEIMPDSPASNAKAPEVDESVVQQLAEMGFPVEACRKAIHLTGNTGSETAMNWIMEHMGDPDFASPITSMQATGKTLNFTPDEDGVSMLMSMGFTRDQSTLALKETGNNLERAADWIFSHQPQLDVLVAADKGASAASAPAAGAESSAARLTDGSPKYELVGFISHMGTSIFVGHYVCHIKKDGEWTLFNDDKVFKSEDPPKDLGYIYFYKRQ